MENTGNVGRRDHHRKGGLLGLNFPGKTLRSEPLVVPAWFDVSRVVGLRNFSHREGRLVGGNLRVEKANREPQFGGKPGPMRRAGGTTRQVRKEATDVVDSGAVVSLAPPFTLDPPPREFGVQTGISTPRSHQLGMLPGLDQFAMVQDQNLVGIADRT